ncbi:ABC transporter permease [Clostridium tarantellae]|uniref:FtsX-like permease family protein n=1 Tax=Clostridium tarantellae TaxID=39493 RepID=A0A6I1MMK8_9CLOT|nr:ABC transporter permease [Clostridium tarantellae]MPQ44244.1 FtsX-like permease family protein [Clostridium tarantellae]
MKNALLKDTFREIKKSFGRFMSIFIIVTLGVAFFSGIKVAAPDMLNTADTYFDNYKFMDVKLVSTLGFSQEDIDFIKNVPQIKGIFATHSMEAITKINNKEMVVKIEGIPLGDNLNNDENYLNRVNLIKGRYPEKEDECLIEAPYIVEGDSAFKIGDTIKLNSGTDKSITDNLKLNEYKIVGIVQSPNYISAEKGSSAIGNGRISKYVMIPEEDFKMDAYTEVYLTVKDADSKSTYKDSYFDIINPVKSSLQKIGDERSIIRYEQILKDANEELQRGNKELADNKLKAEEEFKKAEAKISEGKDKILKGEKELNLKEKEFNSNMENVTTKLSQGEEKLIQGEKEYNYKLNQFNDNKGTIENTIKNTEEDVLKIEKNLIVKQNKINDLKVQLNSSDISDAEKNILKEELKKEENELHALKALINKNKEEMQYKKNMLIVGSEQLQKIKDTIDSSKKEIKNQKANIEEGKKKAINEFNKAKYEISKGKEEIKKAEEELVKRKKEAEEEIKKAEEKINDAENKIKDIPEGKWYVLDRNSNYGYVGYKQAADTVNAIAKVFPIFFFLVAALICSTTMTRMVDENRINIGTLKALGYGKFNIASKYILYAVIASFGGSILGVTIGFTIFPVVIFKAYSMMYALPKLILSFNLFLALIGTLIAVLVTTLAAFFACNSELKEVPAMLMRPKAPKEGKRIFLERIDFIWKRLNFIEKVTARNLFRYKKRFFMTVLGIAGCTALLVTGFGIRDSISSMETKQFGDIFNYDVTISLNKKVELNKNSQIFKEINNDKRLLDSMIISSKNTKAYANDIKKDVNIIVPEDINKLKEFIKLRNRTNKDILNISSKGVIISEKLSKLLKVKVGETIEIENNDGKRVKAIVDGITENYVSHFIYMSKEVYEKTYGGKLEFNQILSKCDGNSKALQEELSLDLMSRGGVSSVSFNSSENSSFSSMLENLNYVVILIIISAGALAFVVLYNLNNVNISERLREIATIKVLGFYDKEVSAYVYRENIILTIIGTLLGLFLGIFLHRFIMLTAELENIMFGRDIRLISFIYSALITIIFAFLVNFVMYFKLKKINMVESLKSVD